MELHSLLSPASVEVPLEDLAGGGSPTAGGVASGGVSPGSAGTVEVAIEGVATAGSVVSGGVATDGASSTKSKED